MSPASHQIQMFFSFRIDASLPVTCRQIPLITIAIQYKHKHFLFKYTYVYFFFIIFVLKLYFK